MRRIVLALGALLAGLALAGATGGALVPAAAAGTSPTTLPTIPGPKPTPKPAAKPAPARVRIYLPDAFFVHREAVTVPGRLMHMAAMVRPYVKGQWVTVQVYAGRRLILTRRHLLRRSRRGVYGYFSQAFRAPHPGRITIVVTHVRTSAQVGFLRGRRMAALDENVGFGSTGRFVQLVQQRLKALHFYIPQSGVYDQGTGLALDAYHRLLGWGTYQTLDGPTISWLLNGWGKFKVRDPNDGTHAEGDLSNQLLALIYGRKVYWIFPISSGKPSTPTILGHFNVYYRVPGYLPDGMYYSSFFYSGYAIHGYDPAPDYPASHGCMRLPIVDAIPAYNWLNYGDAVDTYY